MDEETIKRARQGWQHRGQQRPDFAIDPGPGQESVWDYPRPPALVSDPRHIRVKLHDVMIADTHAAIRVLETASPPTFYIPPTDVDVTLLRAEQNHTFCEWKGQASYYSVCIAGQCVTNAAWSYPEPLPDFIKIKNYLAFYPARVACYVNDERVRPQQGNFYAGWVTNEIIGPFKGEPGTAGW